MNRGPHPCRGKRLLKVYRAGPGMKRGGAPHSPPRVDPEGRSVPSQENHAPAQCSREPHRNARPGCHHDVFVAGREKRGAVEGGGLGGRPQVPPLGEEEEEEAQVITAITMAWERREGSGGGALCWS